MRGIALLLFVFANSFISGEAQTAPNVEPSAYVAPMVLEKPDGTREPDRSATLLDPQKGIWVTSAHGFRPEARVVIEGRVERVTVLWIDRNHDFVVFSSPVSEAMRAQPPLLIGDGSNVDLSARIVAFKPDASGTMHLVSLTGRITEYRRDYVLTDMTGYPGMSGGMILDGNGKLVAIIRRMSTDTRRPGVWGPSIRLVMERAFAPTKRVKGLCF